MWGALLNPSPSNWQKRPPTSLEFVWMHFKVNIWLPTDCWTSFLAGHFCQFILLNFISRNFFHSIPSDSPSSIIHSFVHFFRFAANWFNIHANFLFADLYYNNFYAQLSYKLHLLLRNCNVPISCPCPSLPFPFLFLLLLLYLLLCWLSAFMQMLRKNSLISNSLITFELLQKDSAWRWKVQT